MGKTHKWNESRLVRHYLSSFHHILCMLTNDYDETCVLLSSVHACGGRPAGVVTPTAAGPLASSAAYQLYDLPN